MDLGIFIGIITPEIFLHYGYGYSMEEESPINNSKGYTLVELLAVIVIMGILAGIAGSCLFSFHGSV